MSQIADRDTARGIILMDTMDCQHDCRTRTTHDFSSHVSHIYSAASSTRFLMEHGWKNFCDWVDVSFWNDGKEYLACRLASLTGRNSAEEHRGSVMACQDGRSATLGLRRRILRHRNSFENIASSFADCPDFFLISIPNLTSCNFPNTCSNARESSLSLPFDQI